MHYVGSREQHRVYERRYREKLKTDSERLEKKRAATKAWRDANPEKKTLYSRNSVAATRKNKPWLLAFKSARRRSYKYGMAFTLTQEWVASQFEFGSAISGIPFSNGMGPFPHRSTGSTLKGTTSRRIAGSSYWLKTYSKTNGMTRS